MCFDCDEGSVTRRSFLAGAAAAAAGAALGARALAQESPDRRALDDPKVTHGEVTFKSGTDTMTGFLARPGDSGRHRAILVLHGNPGLPTWVRNTAARLAQAGRVGLVVDIASRSTKEEKPREYYLTNAFDRQVAQDSIAAIEYLKAQPFAKRDGIGIVGFCFGGRRAFLLPTESPDVKAAVAFYGPVRDRVFRSGTDPRPDVMDAAGRIKVPVQGHYGELDQVAVAADAREFERVLRAQGTPVEMFYYQGAGHGFYGNSWREQTPEFGYQAEAAKLAQARMVRFLRRYLE